MNYSFLHCIPVTVTDEKLQQIGTDWPKRKFINPALSKVEKINLMKVAGGFFIRQLKAWSTIGNEIGVVLNVAL